MVLTLFLAAGLLSGAGGAATPSGAALGTTVPLALGRNLESAGGAHYTLTCAPVSYTLTTKPVGLFWQGLGARLNTTVPLILGWNVANSTGAYTLACGSVSYLLRIAPSQSDFQLTAQPIAFGLTLNPVAITSNASGTGTVAPGAGHGGRPPKPPRPPRPKRHEPAHPPAVAQVTTNIAPAAVAPGALPVLDAVVPDKPDDDDELSLLLLM